MENRNVRSENCTSVFHQRHSEAAVRETSLSEAELHSLIHFFQLLDQWDRELVHNLSEESEVNSCKVQ
jgi:hypothetical protein